MLIKVKLLYLTGLIKNEWMGPIRRKKSVLTYLSHLNWVRSLNLSLLLKSTPRKLKPWLVALSFFFLRLLFIFPNLQYNPACNTICTSALFLQGAYLDILDKLQKRICRERSVCRQNMANLNLFYWYYFGRSLSEMTELAPLLILAAAPLVIQIGCIMFVPIPRFYKDIYVSSLFSFAGRLFACKIFFLTYDLTALSLELK